MRKAVQGKLLKNMTKAELVAKAAEVGLEVASPDSVKKDDLIALIEEAIASARVDVPAPPPKPRKLAPGAKRYRTLSGIMMDGGHVEPGTVLTFSEADEETLLKQGAIEPA